MQFLSALSLLVALIGIPLTLLIHRHGTKPSATEIASELRQSLRVSSGDRLGGDYHLIDVVDVKVSAHSNWVDELENSHEMRGNVLLKGLFTGTAEVILRFDFPEQPPEINTIRRHPYYQQRIYFEGKESGVNGYQINSLGDSLAVNVEFWTRDEREGAVCTISTLTVFSQIVDDIREGKLGQPDSIPPFEVFLDQLSRDDVDSPITPIDELSPSDLKPE